MHKHAARQPGAGFSGWDIWRRQAPAILPHLLAGTIDRWLRAWRTGGLEPLKPSPPATEHRDQ
jgi:hypothetical protein